MPLIHCCQYVIWDSNQAAHKEALSAMFNLPFYSIVVIFISQSNINCIISTWPNKRFLSHGMLPLSGHDDVALFVCRR